MADSSDSVKLTVFVHTVTADGRKTIRNIDLAPMVQAGEFVTSIMVSIPAGVICNLPFAMSPLGGPAWPPLPFSDWSAVSAAYYDEWRRLNPDEDEPDECPICRESGGTHRPDCSLTDGGRFGRGR